MGGKCGFIKRDLQRRIATCTGCNKTVEIPFKIRRAFCEANTRYQVESAFRWLNQYIHEENSKSGAKNVPH